MAVGAGRGAGFGFCLAGAGGLRAARRGRPAATRRTPGSAPGARRRVAAGQVGIGGSVGPPPSPERSAADSPAGVNVTVNSLAVTATEQGVRHDWPTEVRASAPAGSDSNCMVVAAGADRGRSSCIQLGKTGTSGKAQSADRDGDKSLHDRYRPTRAADEPRYCTAQRQVSAHPAMPPRDPTTPPRPPARPPEMVFRVQCAPGTVNEGLTWQFRDISAAEARPDRDRDAAASSQYGRREFAEVADQPVRAAVASPADRCSRSRPRPPGCRPRARWRCRCRNPPP